MKRGLLLFAAIIGAIQVKQPSLEGCTLDGLTAREQMLQKYDVVKRLATMSVGEYVDLVKLKGSSKQFAAKGVPIKNAEMEVWLDDEIFILSHVQSEYTNSLEESFMTVQKCPGGSKRTESLLVLEFEENGDMDGLLEFMKKSEKSFSEDSLKEFLFQFLNALKSLQEEGVVSLNLKTGNTFLTDDFKRIKLGDFGGSSVASRGTEYFHTTLELRPPEFFRNCKKTDLIDEEAWRDIMAENQLMDAGKNEQENWRLWMTGGCTAAETKVWNHPAYDIWGLGRQMLALITITNDNEFRSGFGISAWAPTPLAQKQAVLDGEPPSLKDFNYSDEFKTLVLSLLIKDPKKRPTASELLSTPLMKKYTEQREGMQPTLFQEYGHLMKK